MSKVQISATIDKDVDEKIRELAAKDDRLSKFSHALNYVAKVGVKAVEREKYLKGVIKSLMLSLRAHPDCTEDSEFETMVNVAKKALKS